MNEKRPGAANLEEARAMSPGFCVNTGPAGQQQVAGSRLTRWFGSPAKMPSVIARTPENTRLIGEEPHS